MADSVERRLEENNLKNDSLYSFIIFSILNLVH
jgi:hypothetical protein